MLPKREIGPGGIELPDNKRIKQECLLRLTILTSVTRLQPCHSSHFFFFITLSILLRYITWSIDTSRRKNIYKQRRMDYFNPEQIYQSQSYQNLKIRLYIEKETRLNHIVSEYNMNQKKIKKVIYWEGWKTLRHAYGIKWRQCIVFSHLPAYVSKTYFLRN